mgnify:CR=1 FL=1
MSPIASRVLLLALVCLGLVVPRPTHAARIKDLVTVEGHRENHLVGYGLVVGLQGTGDDFRSAPTRRALARMLNHLGMQIDPDEIRARNVAAVVVTASLAPYARAGSSLDVTVSSVGNALSLAGGTLVATPLKGADLRTYALAQGSLSTGGFAVAGRSGTSQRKNHSNAARVPNGAVVERDGPASMPKGRVVLLLKTADFTTAERITSAIAARLGEPVATTRDAGTVVVSVSSRWKDKVPALIAEIEGIDVTADQRAKIVIDERSGTIVVGGDVRLGPAAVAYGGLEVRITEQRAVFQPTAPFGGGDTAVVPDTDVIVEEGEGSLVSVGPASSVTEVAAALNRLGVKPRDLIAILQALEAAGALHAEIQVL